MLRWQKELIKKWDEVDEFWTDKHNSSISSDEERTNITCVVSLAYQISGLEEARKLILENLDVIDKRISTLKIHGAESYPIPETKKPQDIPVPEELKSVNPEQVNKDFKKYKKALDSEETN